MNSFFTKNKKMTKKVLKFTTRNPIMTFFYQKMIIYPIFVNFFKSFCELLFPFCNEKSQLKIKMLPVGVTLSFIFFVFFFLKKWSRFAPLNPNEMFNFPKFSPYYKCKK